MNTGHKIVRSSVLANISIVLVMQLLFFGSGYFAVFFDIDIKAIGLGLNIFYSVVIMIVNLVFMFIRGGCYHRSVKVSAILAIVLSYFAPGLSACFLCVLAVFSYSILNMEPERNVEEHLIS